MTYLELCQLFVREAGAVGTGPTTVVGQTGEYARIVEWVKQSWIKIQTEKGRRFKFTWVQKEINTTASARTYDMSGESVKQIDSDTFTIFLTTDTESEETPLEYMEYNKFKRLYNYIHSDAEQPAIITVLPDNNLFFEPTPDDDYTIRFDASKSVQVLAADDDVPYLPEEYQYAIIYRALLDYERYEEAPLTIAPHYLEAWNRLLWEQEDVPEEMVVQPS